LTTKDTIRIRNAQTAEMAAILELTLAAYDELATNMPAVNWRGLSATIVKTLGQPGNAEVIVAELGNELVGSVLLFPGESAAYGDWVERANFPELRLLAVKPSAQRRGIGNLLINECIQRARQAGATALGLHTSDSMSVALPMYVRRGFVRVPELDFDVEGGEVVKAFRLDLTPA